MLEADPAELAAGSASDLSRHLESCAACRATAAEILAAERGLAEWLAAARPRGEDAGAVARAAAVSQRRNQTRREWAVGALLAAAAALVLLLLPRTPPPAAPSLAVAPLEAGHFSVTAPPGRDVIVMHTSNPEIVVVWYLPFRRTS
jgi:anti-sigma factor RsiW